MASGVTRSVSGSYVGTGAAQDVKLDKVGFKPKRVTIYRMTTRQDKAEHVEGMADASFLFTKGDDGVRSLVTAQGVTLNDTGFSLGTDVAVNAAADTYRYFAEE
jgi:hypothetical protein